MSDQDTPDMKELTITEIVAYTLFGIVRLEKAMPGPADGELTTQETWRESPAQVRAAFRKQAEGFMGDLQVRGLKVDVQLRRACDAFVQQLVTRPAVQVYQLGE